jgi:acyl-CoA thioesterase-1
VAKDKKTAFMPFLLEGVAGESNLNQKDGIHPTKEGHQIIANNLWKYLLPLVTTTIN